MQKSGRAVVGVDVGGTKILVGLVSDAGKVLRVERYAMDRSTQASSMASIEAAVTAFLGAPGDGPAPLAMGMGVVGQTDPATATWVRAMNIPIHESINIQSWLGDRYGLPVALDNDVHAATLAELRWGAGGGARDFIYLNVGTGLAAGLVCNGQLVRGVSNHAGELGHMAVAGDDILCPCGRHGCLEPVASGGGMIQRVRDLLPQYSDSTLHKLQDELTSQAIFAASDAGDALAQRIASEAVEALAKALANLINLLNPEVIVVGGGVLADGWFLPRVQAATERQALGAAYRALRGILPSALNPGWVGLLGAATLAWGLVAQE